MRTLRLDPHLLQHQADLPADRFPLVIWRNVHIAGPVVWDLCVVALFIDSKQIELHLGAERKPEAPGVGLRHRLFEDASGIPLKGPAVRVGDVTEHPHHLALFWAPGELDQGGGVRVEQKIGSNLAAESIHCRCVKGDPVCKGALELAGHDGYIVLLSIDIAEG